MYDDGLDFGATRLRRLTPQQWEALKTRVRARAQAERMQVIRKILQQFIRRICEATHWLTDAFAKYGKLAARAN